MEPSKVCELVEDLAGENKGCLLELHPEKDVGDQA